MNNNNAVYIASAAMIAIFATGCTTADDISEALVRTWG